AERGQHQRRRDRLQQQLREQGHGRALHAAHARRFDVLPHRAVLRAPHGLQQDHLGGPGAGRAAQGEDGGLQVKRALLLTLLVIAPHAFAWGGTPDWVKAAAKMQLPTYPPDTAGVVLVDETTTTIRGAGEIGTLRRQAYKILSTEGRDLGYAA